MSTIENSTTEHQGWQLTAISESLGDLNLTVDNALSIGRGKDNDVVLGSKQVSRHHAELNVLNGELYIKDLGSSNGTMVNEHRLEPNKSKHLTTGDTVNFAVFAFEVIHSQAAAAVDKPVSEETLSSETSKNIEPTSSIETIKPVVSEPVVTAGVEESEAKASFNEDIATDNVLKANTIDESQNIAAKNTHNNQKLEAEAMQTDKDKEDYPVSTEEVGKITQEKLEAELEEPIPFGDPDQQSQQPVPESTGAVDDTIHSPHNDETSREHFAELAEEADPEVLRAKQAAAAKFSGTVGVNTDETESVEGNPTETNPTGTSHNVQSNEPTQQATQQAKLTDYTASHSEPTTEKAVDYETETTTHTPIEETPPRPLTQTEAQIPEVSTDKSNMMIWVVMAIIVIALAIWLISTGMNN